MRIVGVTGGVDTHADTHVAAAVDDNGGLLGVESFPATEAGFAELLGWLIGFGSITQIGVEGTGSWGVGLNRFLNDQEVTVVEVDRPNRQQRRKAGKSDPSDANASSSTFRLTISALLLSHLNLTVLKRGRLLSEDRKKVLSFHRAQAVSTKRR